VKEKIKTLKGCGAPESDYFVPDDGSAREKNKRARRKHPSGERLTTSERSRAGIFLCHVCAKKQNTGPW
jgi:hypothetical protein